MSSQAQPSARPAQGYSRSRLLASILVAICIFAVDTFTSLQSAVAVLYLLVLIIADDGACRRPIISFFGLSTILAVLSFELNHGARSEPGAILRLIFSLGTMAVTAGLILRNRKVQNAARDNDLRYRTIFDTLAVAIWEHDFRVLQQEVARLRASGVEDLRGWLHDHPEAVAAMRRLVPIANANKSAFTLLQVPDGEPFFSCLSDILPDDDESFLEGLLALDAGGRLFETETRLRSWTGEMVDVFIALTFPSGAGLSCISGSVTDVTERKRVQALLDRTRTELDAAIRSATIGEMSASIAHDVSQPLTAIRTYTEAARRWLERDPPNVSEALGAMRQAAREADHAGEVVHRVRHLTSRTPPDMVSLQIDPIISTAIELAGRQSQAVPILFVAKEEVFHVRGDRILLQQLLLNLLGNAIESCESTQDAGITVATARQGDMLAITVADTCSGLCEDVARRAFDPFFSTREGGLGLGLTMCRSIVETHGGTISLNPRADGPGAIVTIRFPLIIAP